MDSLTAAFDATLDNTDPPPRSPTPKRVRWSNAQQQQPPHQAFAHRLAKSGRLFVPERMAMAVRQGSAGPFAPIVPMVSHITVGHEPEWVQLEKIAMLLYAWAVLLRASGCLSRVVDTVIEMHEDETVDAHWIVAHVCQDMGYGWDHVSWLEY